MLTVEVDGDGPVGRLVATASPAGWVRAMASNPLATADRREDGKLDVSGVVGVDGQLTVTRDPGIGEPNRGVVELVSGELAKDIACYLSESEQSPAAVVLGVRCLREGRVASAGGLLVQLLPGVSDKEALSLTDRIRALGAVSSRLSTGQGPREWIAKIFPEGCTISGEVPARFFCGCSMERVERALKLLGLEKMRAVLEERRDGSSDVICGFCRMAYTLQPARLRALITEAESEQLRNRNEELGMPPHSTLESHKRTRVEIPNSEFRIPNLPTRPSRLPSSLFSSPAWCPSRSRLRTSRPRSPWRLLPFRCRCPCHSR